MPIKHTATPASPVSAGLRQQQAADPHTTPAALARLLTDSNLHVRRAAAANPSTPSAPRELLLRAGATPDLAGLRPPRGTIQPGELATLATLDEWARRLAARHPACPGSVLADLAGDAVPAIRRDAARHPHTPPTTLARLAADHDSDVRAAAALHPDTPVTTRTRLIEAGATDDLRGFGDVPAGAAAPDFDALIATGPFGVRLAARHPAAPRTLLDQLANDDHWEVRAGLAHNPACPAELLARLATLDGPGLRTGLASHPHTPPDVLTRLSDDPDVRLRAAVAAHPAAPAALLSRMACDGTWAVRCVVARHPGFSDAQRQQMVAAGSTAGLDAFAPPDPGLAPQTLAQLANQGGWGRQLAARHPATPAATLAQLATDADPLLREAAAGHRAFPAAFRDLLVRAGATPDGQGYGPSGPLTAHDAQSLRNHGPWARRLLARHRDADAPTLDHLARDPDHAVRKQAARHPRLGHHTQTILAQDQAHEIRWALARREDLSPDVLDQFSHDVLPAIRLAALHHPRAPHRLAQRLRFDLDEDVRTAARHALNQR